MNNHVLAVYSSIKKTSNTIPVSPGRHLSGPPLAVRSIAAMSSSFSTLTQDWKPADGGEKIRVWLIVYVLIQQAMGHGAASTLVHSESNILVTIVVTGC